MVGIDTGFFGFREIRGKNFNSVGDALPMHISQQIVVVGDEIVGVVKDIVVAGKETIVVFYHYDITIRILFYFRYTDISI